MISTIELQTMTKDIKADIDKQDQGNQDVITNSDKAKWTALEMDDTSETLKDKGTGFLSLYSDQKRQEQRKKDKRTFKTWF